MSYFQKDINTLQALDLPDTFLKEGDFLRVKTDGSGDTEWFDTNTGSVVIGTALVGNGTVTNPSIAFNSDTNTGIYRLGEDDLGITTGGVTRLAINGTSVEVGTLSNNLNLNVNGTSSATRFRAGDGVAGTPSFSFSNTNGTDTGMFYAFDSIDRLRFSAGGTNTLEMNAGQCFFNNRLLANGTGNNTTPSLTFHNDSQTTGYSGQRTNPSTDPRLWAVVNGVQSTELTTTQFNIGLNTSNNTNMKTLNQNGASNFNTFTPSYSTFLLPQTAIGTIGQSLSGCDFDGTNYVVSVAGTGAGNRLWVSQNLSTWTAISDTQISQGNSQVQFGNGIWVYLSRVASQTRQLWTSTAPATTWTQIDAVAPWTTSRTANRLKFINGQFIVLMAGSFIRFSSNGTTWTEYSINGTSYNLNDITYSPELQRYVITTNVVAILHFSGNTITNTSAFTAVTSGVEAANSISYSPKYGRFLFHGNTNNQRFYISPDGINWTFYTNASTVTNTNNTIWINDFGGFFLDMQFNNNNLAISRDGLSFQVVANNLSLNSVNCVYNSTGKVLLIVGSSGSWGSFRNMQNDFNVYVDSDDIYNSFNSNTRFIDNIEYQQQNITCIGGNNHFTLSQFNRSVINFDTSSSNANIYISNFSKIGTKYKILKYLSSSNNVRLHGYQNSSIIGPFGYISAFNSQSSPQTYTIIEAGYRGSFDLTLIDTNTWFIDNVNVYSGAGVERKLGDFNFSGNITVNGTIINPIEDIKDITWPAPATGFDIDNTNIETLGKYNYFISAGNDPIIDLDNLNVSAYNNLTFNFVRHPSATTSGNYVIRNSMGGSNLVLVYCNGVMNALTSVLGTDTITIDKDQWCRCTYKHNWISGNNYWVVHQYNSNV